MIPVDTLQASEEFEAEGEEAVPARGLPSPTQQTRKEIQENVLTRLPSRSLCGHCLRKRGASLPHFRSKTEGEQVVPTVSIDYFFMVLLHGTTSRVHLDKRKLRGGESC